MTRHLPTVTIALCVAVSAFSSGCQRPMGAANGPYAPAGSLSPASPPPLIPLGALNGATRVPPPPTGSSQVSTGYDGHPPAMSTASAGSPAMVGSGLAADMAQADTSRTRLGGMPVIDLTAGMTPAAPPIVQQPMAVPPAAGGVPDAAVAAAAGWQAPGGANPATAASLAATPSPAAAAGAAEFEPSISVPPSDLAARLRPLEPGQAAVMLPLADPAGSAPTAHSTIAMTQYRTEVNPSPAWQAVAPAVALEPVSGHGGGSGNAFDQQPVATEHRAQSPPAALPSTDPVQRSAAEPPPTASLLWRNPKVAK